MRQRYSMPTPGEAFNHEIFYLGALCKRGHDWEQGKTLRGRKSKNCILCARIDASDRRSKRSETDREICNAKAAAYARERRLNHGRESRSKHGLPYMPIGNAEIQMMHKAIRNAGRIPSVARLVYEQQHKYWAVNPSERAEYNKQKALRNQRWRYMTNISYRLYHRSKSKRRKAQEKGSRTVILSRDQLLRRWVEFDCSCAYCASTGDLHVEHVVPISKGGEHHLGNIVPACQRCNFSKGKSDAETWYRSQLFFSETRWIAILSALTKGQPLTQFCLF